MTASKAGQNTEAPACEELPQCDGGEKWRRMKQKHTDAQNG